MSQQLSWSREGETLKLSGELDQDLLNHCGTNATKRCRA